MRETKTAPPEAGTSSEANSRTTEVVRVCRQAVAEDNADVLVMGGAAFAEMADRIAMDLPVPVISPVPYAVAIAEQAVLTGWRVPAAGSYSQPGKKETKGLGDALSGFFC